VCVCVCVYVCVCACVCFACVPLQASACTLCSPCTATGRSTACIPGCWGAAAPGSRTWASRGACWCGWGYTRCQGVCMCALAALPAPTLARIARFLVHARMQAGRQAGKHARPRMHAHVAGQLELPRVVVAVAKQGQRGMVARRVLRGVVSRGGQHVRRQRALCSLLPARPHARLQGMLCEGELQPGFPANRSCGAGGVCAHTCICARARAHRSTVPTTHPPAARQRGL